jgi:hypothetical protein
MIPIDDMLHLIYKKIIFASTSLSFFYFFYVAAL